MGGAPVGGVRGVSDGGVGVPGGGGVEGKQDKSKSPAPLPLTSSPPWSALGLLPGLGPLPGADGPHLRGHQARHRFFSQICKGREVTILTGVVRSLHRNTWVMGGHNTNWSIWLLPALPPARLAGQHFNGLLFSCLQTCK